MEWRIVSDENGILSYVHLFFKQKYLCLFFLILLIFVCNNKKNMFITNMQQNREKSKTYLIKAYPKDPQFVHNLI